MSSIDDNTHSLPSISSMASSWEEPTSYMNLNSSRLFSAQTGERRTPLTYHQSIQSLIDSRNDYASRLLRQPLSQFDLIPVLSHKLPDHSLVIPILKSIPRYALALYFDFDLTLLSDEPAQGRLIPHPLSILDIVHPKDHAKLPQLLELAKNNLNAIYSAKSNIRKGHFNLPTTRQSTSVNEMSELFNSVHAPPLVRPRVLSSPAFVKQTICSGACRTQYAKYMSYSPLFLYNPHSVPQEKNQNTSVMASIKFNNNHSWPLPFIANRPPDQIPLFDTPLIGTDVYQLSDGLRFYTGRQDDGNGSSKSGHLMTRESTDVSEWKRFHVWAYLARSYYVQTLSTGSNNLTLGDEGEYIVLKIVTLPY